MKHQAVNWRSRINTWPGRECKQRANADGYMMVGLWRDRKVKTLAVHRMVAAAFVGPRPDGREVNHKDGDKQNNNVANLEYVSHAENMRHAVAAGLHDHYAASTKGEAHWKAKLTADDVREIRTSTEKRPVLASRFGVCVAMITRIRQRKSWRHVE